MNRFIVIACALMLGGCSLLWIPDRGPDASIDAFAIDANLDALMPPDAGTDAWMRPLEICNDLPQADEDGDGSSNCNDSDCFGTATCCLPSTGMPLPDTNITNWTAGGTMIVESGTPRRLNFGTSGYARRDFCVPLAQGADIDFTLAPQPVAGTLGIVFSPATAPSAKGFLDELAVRVEDNEFFVTRAGSRVALRPPTGMGCIGDADHYSFSGSAPLRVFFRVRPGVAANQPAVLVSIDVLGLCSATQTVIEDAAIPLADLVTTTDGEGASCDANRGLYVAFEGTGARFALGDPALPISVLECASPGNFNPQSTVLSSAALASGMAPDFAAGGIGAPDLISVTSSNWMLAYDGSVEPRASELFGNLTMAVGLGQGSSHRATPWTSVLTLPNLVDAREPAVHFLGSGNYEVLYARRVGSTFQLWKRMGMLTMPFGDATAVLTSTDCSYREPAFVDRPTGDSWVLFRCDNGARSTLGRATQNDATGVITQDATDLLGGALGSIRAVDAVFRNRYLAVWVLTEERGGTQSLHFYSGEIERDGDRFPSTLAPYAGNPVLRSTELQEDCGSVPCAIQSFAVEPFVESGRTYLRFLFARSRTSAGATVSEFIARNQLAPPGLR